MGLFDINIHGQVTEKFLLHAPVNSEINVITSYFNPPEDLQTAIIQNSNAHINILTPSSEVNIPVLDFMVEFY